MDSRLIHFSARIYISVDKQIFQCFAKSTELLIDLIFFTTISSLELTLILQLSRSQIDGLLNLNFRSLQTLQTDKGYCVSQIVKLIHIAANHLANTKV